MSSTPDDATLLEMQRRMLRIRRFDERASKMVKRGQIPGTVHTSIGQEAQVVGSCMALDVHDYMTGNHRSHGHPIGKGAPLGPLMAELVGKATGVCKGKGGSLHLADFAVGSLGESGIVGSSIPIATGAALSAKVLGNGRVALAFFGDGAANQGCLYEAMNMAGIWGLPVVFLCENNQYALSTPAHTVTSGVIADRAAGFGIAGVRVENGQDVLAVHDAVSTAVGRARLVLNVDHHHDNTRFGAINLVVAEASSTGEIVREAGELATAQRPAIEAALKEELARYQAASSHRS